MLPPERPDRITVAFDDHRLVVNAGLILPVTLAHHLGLGELVDNYAGQRGYHPLFFVAAGTGGVLMCRLRKGRANTARGAAHFLRETVGRVRYAGATGPLIRLRRTGRQRLLQPRHRRCLPCNEGPLFHHRPPALQFAEHHRGHTRGRLDAHSILDGGRRRRGRD